MAYKRLFAILLGMVMTVEAVPASVFAKELDPSSDNRIVNEEVQAEEPEATETTVSETTAKKEKETPKPENKEPSVSETEKKAEEKAPEETKAEEPAETEVKEETEPSENEPADKEPDETKATEETTCEDKAQDPSETDANEPEESDKEAPVTDSRDPVNSNDQEKHDLKDGEVIYETGTRPFESDVPGKKDDNDEQLESYFKKKAEEELGRKPRQALRKAAPAPAAGSRLTGNEKIAYDYFKSEMTKVANGSRNVSVFEIPITYFNLGLENMSWTAEDLGVSSLLIKNSAGDTVVNPQASAAVRNIVKIPIDLNAVDDALLADCPFELYWFDKTYANITANVYAARLYSYALGVYKAANGVYRIKISAGPTGCFWVSNDYSGGLYNDGLGIKGNYLTSSSKISRVNTAVKKAASIVKNASSKPDYQKLVYYCDQIKGLVYYDKAAVTGSRAYGDPWQLISVFDGNTSTNVVCEGYAKAFMYLCNLTEFKGNIQCITVTGEIPAGGHMWNVVNMDDGKNYLVDITNIDGHNASETALLYKALFLAGYNTKITNGYNVSGIEFTYDEETLASFGSEQIALNDQNYYIARPVTVSANGNNGTPELSASSAKPGDKVTITPNPKPGYEFEYAYHNGETTGGEYFYMTGVPAVIEVFYRLKTFTVTVNTSEGGSAEATPVSGHYGDTVNLKVTPDNGYALDKITVNNGDPLTGTSFKIGLENPAVSVTFKKIPHAITVKCGAHGTASADLSQAGVGDTVTLDIVPEEGYYPKSVTVNGEPVIGKTFLMLPEAVTVVVEFDLITQAAVGEDLTDGINNYRVTNNAMGGSGTVAFTGSANNAASVSIPAVVTLKGIPYKVTKIASYAFNNNPYVTSVYIGSNVSVIETRAFVGCSKLTKISGGAKLKTISTRAIISCTKLKYFTITSSVLSKIGSYAFSGDKSLKTINIKKTKKLSKKRVKKSLKGSSVKTVKVKKSKVRKYKRYFTKKNCGRKVKVKK